jgi:hypothetical protein
MCKARAKRAMEGGANDADEESEWIEMSKLQLEDVFVVAVVVVVVSSISQLRWSCCMLCAGI